MHDVLGFSLSAVALRSELVLRLKDRASSRARTEQAALLELVDRAPGELGSIASGRIRLRLRRGLDSVVQALSVANSTTDAHVETGQPPAEVDSALAVMLRESVTNVLRHSRARRCEISIVQTGEVVRLDIANDGVRGAGAEPGTALANVAERTGGSVRAGRRPGGRFEPTVEFPSAPRLRWGCGSRRPRYGRLAWRPLSRGVPHWPSGEEESLGDLHRVRAGR
ncbi:hypothetical protein ABT299_22615 [Spirillospora sp. NPDC000708]